MTLRGHERSAKLMDMKPFLRTNALWLLLAVLGAGCKAHMMETHGDKIQLLKTGQEKSGRGGVLRYLKNGPAAFKSARRSDAESQMKKFCSGAYTITAEGPRSKVGASMPIGGKVSIEFDEYQYVAFQCAETDAS